MKKTPTDRFFEALCTVSSEIAGSESAVAKAAKVATETPSPMNYVKAQEALALVTENLREQILQKVHCRLRNDIEAIWDQLPNAPKTDRQN